MIKSNIILLLVFIIFLPKSAFSQSPPGIPYQAIARTTTGEPYASGALQARFSLHEQTATGTVSYAETHSLQTDEFGLFSTTFGAGAPVTGTFTAINWGLTTKYLQVEIDLGNGWINMGTQQLMSVPYALYAGSAGNNSSTNNSSNNSNYTPSADSVLTLISAGTLQQGSYTVPAGEYWKIVSFYTLPSFGSGLVSANLGGCSWQTNAQMYRCVYAFPSYPIVTINSISYNASIPASYGVVYGSQFGTEPNCSFCPQTELIQTNYTFNLTVPMPIWLSPNETLTLHNQHARITLEKYK